MYVNVIWRAVLLATWASSCRSLQTYETIDDLVISSDYLYVADGTTLHLLHNNLTHLCSLDVGNATISKIAVSTDEAFVIVCLINGICESYKIESLLEKNPPVILSVSAVKATSRAIKGIALAVTPNSSFYQAYTMEASKRVIVLRQFEYNRSTTLQLRTTEELITNSKFISRDFYDAFKTGYFIYYVAVDTIGNMTRLTVMRIRDDNGEHFSELIEIELDCGTTTSVFGITSPSLIRDPHHSGDNNTMVVIAISSKSISRVCSYQLADIDKELQRTYYEYISSGTENPLPWADYDHAEDCSKFTKQEATECNFGLHSFTPALSAINSIPGTIMLETADEVTATLAFQFDNIQFLFVAHTNTLGFHLMQYYILRDTRVSLIKMETINSAVRHLRHNDEYIYAATDSEVLIIALDNCSSYIDCVSCIENHICGWCTLEGTCSRKTNCEKSHLRNRWTRNSNSCISHVMLLQQHSAVTPLTANVTVTPVYATFPEVDPSEEYNCHFINNAQNYSFTLPFVGGKCCDASVALIPSFGFKQIELQLRILTISGDKVFTSFSANNTLTIYNCSFSSSCRKCAAMDVCGWCIYDNKCAGSKTLCPILADWRSISMLNGNSSRCPALLTPKHGWYLQSVSVSNKLELHTRDLPLLIPGYKYMCELRDPSGLSIVTKSIPINESQAICQIEQNQITIPESSMTGVMALQLNLVLVNENRSFSHVIEWEKDIGDGNLYSDGNTMEEPPTTIPSINQTSFNMLIFNCSYFGHDCSSCLAATSGTNLPCVWCPGDNPNSGTCLDLAVSKCLESFTVVSGGAHQCPQPQITSVSPSSGHIDGGTVLTISGSNLGVSVNDVSVLIGTIECPLLQAEYKPGKEIVCTTNSAQSEGKMTITVQIRRAQTVVMTTYSSFNYALPHIALVHPRYGPVSGGTVVTISGSALDVGNMEAIRINVVEEICDIINITSTQLTCKTSEKDTHSIGMIFIEYGSARVSGENYLYTPNPRFTSIFPHNTIPAGGIALNFTGHNLNVTQNPRIVIYIGNNSYINSCRTNDATSLHCTAPTLPSLTHILEIVENQQQGQRDGRNIVVLNYTLIMDSAPGPCIDRDELLLGVKANPVLVEVEEGSKAYITGSEDTITIIGKNLDSIDLTEIIVYVGEYACRLIVVTPMFLKCKPDITVISSTPQTITIKVFISSTLEYNLGHIEILNNGTMNNGSSFSQIIAAVVAVIIFTIIVFCIFVIATCMCLKKKSREFRLKQVPVERNSYFSGLGDDLYDHIEDAPKDTVCRERKLNNYLYNINEDVNPSNNSSRQDTRTQRDNLPQIPQLQDDYVDMQSHSVQLQSPGLKSRSASVHCQASRTGSSGEYVAMLPASRPECKHSSEDYADIEEVASDPK